MFQKTAARFAQFTRELAYVTMSVEALVCTLYSLSGEMPESKAATQPLVVVDRGSIKGCLRLLVALGILPPFEVKVVTSGTQLHNLLAELGTSPSARHSMVVSRLLYGKYYPRLRELVSRRILVVA